jgi:hypothetical protein
MVLTGKPESEILDMPIEDFNGWVEEMNDYEEEAGSLLKILFRRT